MLQSHDQCQTAHFTSSFMAGVIQWLLTISSILL